MESVRFDPRSFLLRRDVLVYVLELVGGDRGVEGGSVDGGLFFEWANHMRVNLG